MEKSMSGELIQFITPDKVKLFGFLVSNKKNKKVVIHIHGLTSNFYRGNLFWKLAEIYVKKGYDFLSIDTRGAHIVSKVAIKKGRKWDKMLAGGAFEKFEDSAHDIRGAIDYCAKRKYKQIILQGHSTGCQKSIYYQSKKKDRRVRGIVLLAPAEDLPALSKELGKKFNPLLKTAKKLSKMKGHESLLGPKDYSGIISADRFLSLVDPKRNEAQIFDYSIKKFKQFRKVKTPILAVFGSDEEYKDRPVKEYLDLLENANNSKKFNRIEIKGANHGFYGKENQLGKVVLNWLKTLN